MGLQMTVGLAIPDDIGIRVFFGDLDHDKDGLIRSDFMAWVDVARMAVCDKANAA